MTNAHPTNSSAVELDRDARKAALNTALPLLERGAAPFHVIDEAIRAYLSRTQGEAEPVGWVRPETLAKLAGGDGGPIVGVPYADTSIPLYASPVAPAGEQELALAWLASYLLDLKQNPHRHADEILHLERLSSLLAASPPPAVSVRAAERGDEMQWFDACWKISGTGMSKVRFLEKYVGHMGVSDEVAARMMARLRALSTQRVTQ